MGAEHIPPKATEVPRLMNELLYTSFKSGDFLYDLADFHIRYERIHPFGNGNGRTGRVLLNKISLENGYLPFVIPKEKRDIYMNLLADCDIEGMKKLIEGFMKNEEKRMVEFGIDTEKFGFGYGDKLKGSVTNVE
jgi:Fic family protein